ASQVMGSNAPLPFGPVRRSSVSSRSGLYTLSRYRSTLTQRWRPVIGCERSATISTARPSSFTVTRALHASGQSCVHVTRTRRSVMSSHYARPHRVPEALELAGLVGNRPQEDPL